MRNPSGMNTYHGQVKDRENWKKSIDYRNKLIKEAMKLGLKLNRPNEMKISELETLVQQHYKNNQ